MPNISNLSIYYQNARSIKSKVNEVYYNLSDSEFDIVCITESWLDSSVDDNEFMPPNFDVFRTDRDFVHTGRRRGGGVILAVNRTYAATNVDLSACNLNYFIDIVGCKLNLGSNMLYIIVIYIPPDVTVPDFESFFEYLENLILNYPNILLIGDFNSASFSSGVRDSKSDIIRNMMSFLDLRQHNAVYNCDGRLLDLAFSNLDECAIERDTCPIVREDLYHPALSVNITFKNSQNNKFSTYCTSAKTYNFKKANFHALYLDLLKLDWSTLFECTDVNTACDLFYEKLYTVFDKHVPLVRCRKLSYPSWYSSELREQIKVKQKFFKMYKCQKTLETKKQFFALRRSVKMLIKRDFRNYVINAEKALLTTPKHFWSYVKEKKGHSTVPNKIYFDTKFADNPKDIVNNFAKLFSSNFSNTAVPLDFNNTFSCGSVYVKVNINEVSILKAIKKLKDSRVSGVDQVPSFLIKDCSAVFLEPLLHLFNLISNTACFPTLWKTAKIVPIFKSGDRAHGKNYRPISLLCNFSKLFESVLHSQIYFQIKSLLGNSQHGFTKGRSTLTNLTCMSQDIAQTLDRRSQLDVVYADLTKAFDRVNHQLLVNKLSTFGFSNKLTDLFESYLMDRRNHVVINGYMSDCYITLSGVPQGSTLGPLLFSMYIKDITECLYHSKILIYADDVKLYRQINNDADCLLLQDDVNNLIRSFIRHDLVPNKNKCKIVSFTHRQLIYEFDYHVDNHILEKCDTIKDLGVIYDSKFSFKEHIDYIVLSARKMLGFILRNCKEFSNTGSLKTLYHALVRSKLEYCSLAWHPYYNSQVLYLESVQRKFFKYLFYKEEGRWPERNCSNDLLLGRFNENTLFCRRIISAVVFLHNLINNRIDCSELVGLLNFNIPRFNSRYAITLYYDRTRTNIGKKAPLYVMGYYLNLIEKKIHIDIFHCSIRDLKEAIQIKFARN